MKRIVIGVVVVVVMLLAALVALNPGVRCKVTGGNWTAKIIKYDHIAPHGAFPGGDVPVHEDTCDY